MRYIRLVKYLDLMHAYYKFIDTNLPQTVSEFDFIIKLLTLNVTDGGECFTTYM